MKASGMCGSDLHQYRRPKHQERNATGLPPNPNPTIAGHEPCGIVAAVGPGVQPTEAKVGQRVMVHHYQGCAQCSHCRSGWQQLCQEVPIKVYGNNAHGGHAKYLKVPANTMVRLHEALSFSAGAAISCGSGTAYGALRRMNLSGRDTIAIFGQGPVDGTCPPPAAPVSCTSDGYVSQEAFGYRLRAGLKYPHAIGAVDLVPAVVFGHDVWGWSGDGMLLEGRMLAVVSLQALYTKRWSAALAWQPTWGGTYNNQRDRSTAQAYVSFQF